MRNTNVQSRVLSELFPLKTEEPPENKQIKRGTDKWKHEFYTGEPEIDLDHQIILLSKKNLETLLEQDNQKKLKQLFEEFLDFFEKHIKHEEKFFENKSGNYQESLLETQSENLDSFRRIISIYKTMLKENHSIKMIISGMLSWIEIKLPRHIELNKKHLPPSPKTPRQELLKLGWMPEEILPLGIGTIDRQHADVISKIDSLSKQLSSTKFTIEEIKQEYEKVINLLEEHFFFETELLRQCNYPHALAHQKTHSAIIHKLKQNLETEDSSFYLEKELLLLRSNFLTHIMHSDSSHCNWLLLGNCYGEGLSLASQEEKQEKTLSPQEESILAEFNQKTNKIIKNACSLKKMATQVLLEEKETKELEKLFEEILKEIHEYFAIEIKYLTTEVFPQKINLFADYLVFLKDTVKPFQKDWDCVKNERCLTAHSFGENIKLWFIKRNFDIKDTINTLQ